MSRLPVPEITVTVRSTVTVRKTITMTAEQLEHLLEMYGRQEMGIPEDSPATIDVNVDISSQGLLRGAEIVSTFTEERYE